MDWETNLPFVDEDNAEKTGYKTETVENYAYVARNVNQEIRNEGLSFNHHYLIASIESEEQKAYWLSMAEQYNLSVRGLTDAIKIWRDGGDPVQYLSAPDEQEEDLSPVQNARLKMVQERNKVMKKAQRKKARKLWLTYAKEQAAEWQELVSKISEMQEDE